MKKKNLLFILNLSFILFLTLYTNSYAAYPKLVTTLVNGFETIQTWIIRISTPAAAVAVRYWGFYEKI